MDSEAQPNPQNFHLVHTLKRRIRFIVPALRKDPERTYILAILLRRHDGIRTVTTVPEIASVTVHFDPQTLPSPRLLKLLDGMIANLGNSATQTDTSPAYALRAMADAKLPLWDYNLAIEGMDCPSCALLVEVRLRRDPRIASASVNFATETANVRGSLSQQELFAQIGSMGYRACAVDTLTQRRLLAEREKERLGRAKRRAIWSNLLNLPGLLLAFANPSAGWVRWVEFGVTIPIALWSGQPFFQKAWTLFIKHRSASMDTLIALGVGLAYSQGFFALLARRRGQYFQAGAAAIAFILLGRYLEEKARGKAHEAMRQLIDRQPQTATLLVDGREVTQPIDTIKVGDLLLVRPGERIPTDAEVVDGLSTVDESLLTGESLAVIKQAGDKLVGGCVNVGGALRIRATAVGGDTVLAGIIHSVDLAQASKLPIQARVDRVAAVFMPSVMGVSALTFVGWLMAGASPGQAMTHAIAVMLAACPCALGTATPAAIMVGTGEAARRGIYIRNGESLEMAAKLSVVVFDKTGTLTEGRAEVTDHINLSGETDGRVLSLAASAEFGSEHYLGKALVASALAQGLPLLPAEAFAYVPGRGISAGVDGHAVLLGNQAWLAEQGVALETLSQAAQALAAQGKTPVFFALDGEPVALFGIADQARKNARQAVERLHRLGVRTLMLTGDTAATAGHIARETGITEVVSEATPADKLAFIHSLRRDGKVGMVGDGVNDAPALAAADVGFAIASRSDLAMDSADMGLVRGDLAKVAEAMALGKATLHIVRQNLSWAVAYNSLAIPLAAFGKLSPMSGSIAMSVSSLAMVLNALRLRKDHETG